MSDRLPIQQDFFCRQEAESERLPLAIALNDVRADIQLCFHVKPSFPAIRC